MTGERDVVISNARVLSRWTWRQVLACFGGGFVLYVLLAGLLGALASPAAAVPLSVTGFYALLALGVVVSVVKTRPPVVKAIPGSARVRASREGLWIDGAKVAARGELESGAVLPGKGGALVQIRRVGTSRGEVNLGVATTGDGRSLLQALGLDAGHAVARARARMPFIGWAFLAYFLLNGAMGAVMSGNKPGAALGTAGVVATVTLVVLAYASLFSMFIRSRVTIGTDGVLVEWLGVYRKFIPMREIASVSLDPKRHGIVRIELTSGKVEILTHGRRWFHREPHPETIALKDRIVEALAASRAGGPEKDTSQVLRRGREGNDVAGWVADLRRLLDREAGFRSAAIVPERLWAIVEDAAADAEARAAAAVALGPALDAPGKERLRIAANTTAEPRLRIALEAAETDDETLMAEALEALAPREASRRA
jgi:hypothetical protein